jgi:outer membrane protein assembly factor BamE
MLLPGCFLVPHKIDVQQGNFVDQKMVEKLKPEMTKSQVRFVLGTPLIADPFHPERWDYVYMTGKAGVVKRERRITVVFDGDKLVRIDGDVRLNEKMTQVPSETGKP